MHQNRHAQTRGSVKGFNIRDGGREIQKKKALQRNTVVVSDDAVVVSDDGFLNRALALQALLILPCCQQACPATLLTLQHPDYSPLTALSSRGQTQADTDFDIIHFLSHTSLSFSYTSIVNHDRETFFNKFITSQPYRNKSVTLQAVC